MAVKKESSAVVSQSLQGLCLAAMIILETAPSWQGRGSMKFGITALTVARDGRLAKAGGLDWCCQFGEDAPALPPGMSILPMSAVNAKDPTMWKKGSLGKYTVPPPGCHLFFYSPCRKAATFFILLPKIRTTVSYVLS